MKGFEDALLDIAWNNLESEGARYKDIDNKAIGIITITGILMTFIIGSSDTTPPSRLLTVASIFFLVTIILSIMAMRVRRIEALSTQLLIEDLRGKTHTRQIRGILGTIAAIETNMRSVGKSKTECLKYSVYALGTSVVLIILDSLTPFLVALYQAIQ